MGRNDGHHHHHYHQQQNHHHHGSSYRSNPNRSRHHRNNPPDTRQNNRSNSDIFTNDTLIQPFVSIHQQNTPLFNNGMQQQFQGIVYDQQQQQQQYAQFVPQVNNTPSFDTYMYHPISQNNQQNLIDQQQSVQEPSHWFNSSSSLPNIPTNALPGLQFPANQITDTGIIPTSPYYELPAGIMVPLIKPSQKEYKSLNPSDLRLPLPKFPDENFLRSIEMYYGNDGKIRDNDGWNKEYIDMLKSTKNSS